MNAREIAELYYRSIRHGWDYLTVNAGLEEINSEAVKKFVEVAKNRGRLNVLEGEDLEVILKKLELVRDGKPTRALIPLFGNYPQCFPHTRCEDCEVRGVRLKTK